MVRGLGLGLGWLGLGLGVVLAHPRKRAMHGGVGEAGGERVVALLRSLG